MIKRRWSSLARHGMYAGAVQTRCVVHMTTHASPSLFVKLMMSSKGAKNASFRVRRLITPRDQKDGRLNPALSRRTATGHLEASWRASTGGRGRETKRRRASGESYGHGSVHLERSFPPVLLSRRSPMMIHRTAAAHAPVDRVLRFSLTFVGRLRIKRCRCRYTGARPVMERFDSVDPVLGCGVLS